MTELTTKGLIQEFKENATSVPLPTPEALAATADLTHLVASGRHLRLDTILGAASPHKTRRSHNST